MIHRADAMVSARTRRSISLSVCHFKLGLTAIFLLLVIRGARGESPFQY